MRKYQQTFIPDNLHFADTSGRLDFSARRTLKTLEEVPKNDYSPALGFGDLPFSITHLSPPKLDLLIYTHRRRERKRHIQTSYVAEI